MTSSADSLYQLAPIEISVSFTFEVVSMESVEPDERKTKADKETKENIKFYQRAVVSLNSIYSIEKFQVFESVYYYHRFQVIKYNWIRSNLSNKKRERRLFE